MVKVANTTLYSVSPCSMISGETYVLLLAVVDELFARKKGVTLNLVRGGNDAGLVNQLLEGLVGEVGHANGADLALGEFAHRLPCFTVRYRAVDVDLVGVRCLRKQV